jgi:hypothetical protein
MITLDKDVISLFGIIHLFLTQFYLGYKEKKNKVNLDRQFEWKLK